MRQVYGKAPFFDEVISLVEPAYASPDENLSSFNRKMIETVAGYLGSERKLFLSSELNVLSTGDERLIELTRKVGGTHYISGKGGTTYQDPAKFSAAQVELDVRIYSPLPYEADGFPFVPGLSILDALFILGRNASRLLVYEGNNGPPGAR
jgi:hypothetical protein